MKKTHIPKTSVLPLLALEIIIGSILASLAFLTYVEITHRVLAEDTHLFDQTVTTAIHALRSPLLTEVMLFISFLGGNFLVLPVILIIWYLLKKKYLHETIFFSLAVLAGVVLNLFLKTIVARARPDIAPLISEIFYSFPSGHSMNGFVFYSLIAYLSFHFTRNIFLSIVISIFCGVLILLIGISRVYLGVHYPSDVAAGFLAGFGWLLTIFVIDKTVALIRTKEK